jgi:pimeloyl-ACP methyl ester carboxylesterase
MSSAPAVRYARSADGLDIAYWSLGRGPTLLGWLAGALPAIAYAARNPQGVSHLVLWNGFARDATHGQAPRLRSLFEMASQTHASGM